jgi:hypothetical protein
MTYDFSYLRKYVMPVLVDKISRGSYVDKKELVKILREFAGQQIPKEIIEYTCLILEGKVKVPRGRKPQPAFYDHPIMHYAKNLEWLQRRCLKYKRRLPRFKHRVAAKPTNRPTALHQIAAQWAAKQVRGISNIDYQTVLNRASAIKKRGSRKSER